PSAGYFNIKGIVFDSTDMVLDDPQNLLVDSKVWQVTVGSLVCGDSNHDNLVNVSDVVFLINYLFKGGPEPYPLASADVNLDQKVTVSDVVYLINYLFKGGLEPCHL
ncbi:MAG: dockerin type I domain-containing protein, partial [candidate division Zixibacteria bacterium]|nr:dockerin type I domain-containing protein [candidate division Zixibacteria bacterium]